MQVCSGAEMEDGSGGPASLGLSFDISRCFKTINFCSLYNNSTSPREREADIEAGLLPGWHSLGMGITGFGTLVDISAVATIMLLLADDHGGGLYHRQITRFSSCCSDLVCSFRPCPSSTGSDENINEKYSPFAKHGLYPVLHRRSHPEVTVLYLPDEVLIVFAGFFPP